MGSLPSTPSEYNKFFFLLGGCSYIHTVDSSFIGRESAGAPILRSVEEGVGGKQRQQFACHVPHRHTYTIHLQGRLGCKLVRSSAGVWLSCLLLFTLTFGFTYNVMDFVKNCFLLAGPVKVSMLCLLSSRGELQGRHDGLLESGE